MFEDGARRLQNSFTTGSAEARGASGARVGAAKRVMRDIHHHVAPTVAAAP